MKKIILLLLLISIYNNFCLAQNTFPSTGNVGIGTNTPTSLFHGKEGDFVWENSIGTPYYHSLKLIKSKPAFRVNFTAANLFPQFDDLANIGGWSVGLGLDVKASATNTIAIGERAIAEGAHSYAIGINTRASGGESFALAHSWAEGDQSVSIGRGCISSGLASKAIGHFVKASGIGSMIFGQGFGMMNLNPSGAASSSNYNFENNVPNSLMVGFNLTTSNTPYIAPFFVKTNRVGIRNTNPTNTLEVSADNVNESGLTFTKLTSASPSTVSTGKVLTVDATGKVILVNSDVNNGSLWTLNSSNNTINNVSQKVGIGTVNFPTSIPTANVWNADNGIKYLTANTSNYNLFVKGCILTEEITLKSGWADYVFDEKYTLKPLNEVEDFIHKNKHLPNIPSAKNIKDNGLNIGAITTLQQHLASNSHLQISEFARPNCSLKHKNLS